MRRRLERHVNGQRLHAQRQQALEEVYAIATAFRSPLEAMCEQVVLCLANILKAPYVAIARKEHETLYDIAVFAQGRLRRSESVPLRSHPCGVACMQSETLRLTCDLAGRYPSHFSDEGAEYRSYLGVPVISAHSDIQGALCAMDFSSRNFTEYEARLVAIFARYVGHEAARRKLEQSARQSDRMRLLGQLTSGVAHEVRNPLNALTAVTEALALDLDEFSQYHPYIEHIQAQVSRLSALMQDLLQLGRPVTACDIEPMPILHAVRAAVDSWRLSSPNRDRQVNFDIASDIAGRLIRVEPVKMQQVFHNLIDNACQISPPETHVTILVFSSLNNKVQIQVRDEGPGAAEEDLQRLFEPFFSRRKGGTGLGVTIVRGIVEQYGGKIRYFNNSPGPGLTAEIVLPVCDTRAAHAAGDKALPHT
jgi:signal transduction histidine kinase